MFDDDCLKLPMLMSGSWSLTSRQFQMDRLATEKACQLYVLRWYCGTMTWWYLADHRCCWAGTKLWVSCRYFLL